MEGHKKGQAIMEYLITYGLALFVILIVLAILVAVVLPSLKAPDSCQFTQPGFSCNQKPHVLVADAGGKVRVLFQLDNIQGKAVKILSIICSSSPPGNIQKSQFKENIPSAPLVLASGASASVGDHSNSDIKYQVNCKDADGTTDVILSSNSNFKGTIGIKYTFADDVPGAPERIAVATLAGTVQAE